MASSDIGIDLGTASVLVYVRGKGVVLKEPSVVAYDKDTNEIKAIGEEARQMMGQYCGSTSSQAGCDLRLYYYREDAALLYSEGYGQKDIEASASLCRCTERCNRS